MAMTRIFAAVALKLVVTVSVLATHVSSAAAVAADDKSTLLTLDYSVDKEGKTVRFEAVLNQRSWLAVGLSREGEMEDSDVVVYTGSSTTMMPRQYRLTAMNPAGVNPFSEQDPSYTYNDAHQNGNVTTLIFTRPMEATAGGGEKGGRVSAAKDNNNNSNSSRNSDKDGDDDKKAEEEGQKTAVIWAYGSDNNFGTKRHVKSGTVWLELEAGKSGSAATEEDPEDEEIEEEVEAHELAHGVMMGLAFMLCAPTGALVARFGKQRFGSAWFQWHRALQGLSSLLALTAFAVIYQAVADEAAAEEKEGKEHKQDHSNGKGGDDGHFRSDHAQLGLVLLFVMLLQVILGVCRPVEESPSRGRWHTAHTLVGWSFLFVTWVNIGLGLALYGADSAGFAGYAIVIILWVVIAAATEWRARRSGNTGGGIEKNYKRLALDEPGDEFLDELLADEQGSSTDEEDILNADALNEYAR